MMIKRKNTRRYLRKIIRISLLLLIVLTEASCLTLKKLPGHSLVITHVSDTLKLRGGSLVYALPRTIFIVKVEAERTIEIPGPYAGYADDLLGLKNVIKTGAEHWSVKSISVTSAAEPDPSEFYLIETNNLFQSNVLTMKKEGLILDLNPDLNYQYDSDKESNNIEIDQLRSFDMGSDEYYQVQSDTAFRRIKVDSSFIRIPYIVEKKKKLTNDQLAERAAKRLMELRDGKILILTGEANIFPQSDAPINEINRMEKEYTELFTGKSLSETRLFSYEFIPQKALAGKPTTLLLFSETKGPAEPGSGTGIPLKIEFVPEQKTKDITVISGGEAKDGERKSDKLFYRIPELVMLKVSMDGRTLYSSRKLVYQLGEVLQLPGNFVIGK